MTVTHERRQIILTISCVAILLLTVARLTNLLRKQVRSYQQNRAARALWPESGSLIGIDAQGRVVKFAPTAEGFLLVFVIRSKHAVTDIRFWNEVVRGLGPKLSGSGASIEYWGVCDAGRECNAYQSEATFPILGYLDPFEMHIVARAHSRNEILLYNHRHTRVASLPLASDSSMMARAVVEGTE